MSKSVQSSNEPIINFYALKKVKKLMPKYVNPNYDFHKISIPFRGCVIGSSGSGKTNFLLNLIRTFNGTFNHIYIYSQAMEPLYEFLSNEIDRSLLTIKYGGLASCRDFGEEQYYGQSLVIFDDMCTERDQKCISDLYIRGRKIGGGISLLYLTQSYYKIPKIVRLQCQYIFILKVSGIRDLTMILSEYSLDATKEQLLSMYKQCCQSIFGHFMMIDLHGNSNLTYRQNFSELLSVK